MLIVSDTSPITNLIQINQLELLERIFVKIIIPQKVYDELSYYEKQKEEIDSQTWIEIRFVTNKQEVQRLEQELNLDVGEAEAIVLAKELHANMLVIDERKGRKVAEDQGLKIIGLLGILIRGKKDGYLKELRPLLDKLMTDIGFRVSRKLYERILVEVGEDI